MMNMDHFRENSAYTVNKDAFGHVRIWDLGTKKLLLEKPNLITYQGADIAAKALSGQPHTSISHMYVGYTSGIIVPPVAVGDTITNFSTYARIPLSFSPSYASETADYNNNLVYFTCYITGTAASGAGTVTVPNGENIVHLGLICAGGVDPSADKLFSHIAFNPIAYNSTYGIAITWGLTFRAEA